MRLTRAALSKIRIGIRITDGIAKRVRVLLRPAGLELGGQSLLSLRPSDSVGTAFGNGVLRGLQAPGVSTMGFGKGLGLGGSSGDGSISLGLRRASRARELGTLMDVGRARVWVTVRAGVASQRRIRSLSLSGVDVQGVEVGRAWDARNEVELAIC